MSLSNAIRDAEFPLDEVERVDDFFIFATLMVYGCVAMDFRKIKVWKPLVTLGDWSYSLYLAVTIAVSGLVYHFIEQPMIKAARMMRERLFN